LQFIVPYIAINIGLVSPSVQKSGAKIALYTTI